MKARILIVILIAGFVTGLLTQAGATLSSAGYLTNAKGTGGSPVAVGTNTPVTVMDATADKGRCGWLWSWTEAGNLRCEPFSNATSAAASTPTASHGVIFKAGSVWTANADTDDTSLGWQCVSDSGTANVSTYEVAHCTKKGMNP